MMIRDFLVAGYHGACLLDECLRGEREIVFLPIDYADRSQSMGILRRSLRCLAPAIMPLRGNSRTLYYGPETDPSLNLPLLKSSCWQSSSISNVPYWKVDPKVMPRARPTDHVRRNDRILAGMKRSSEKVDFATTVWKRG